MFVDEYNIALTGATSAAGTLGLPAYASGGNLPCTQVRYYFLFILAHVSPAATTIFPLTRIHPLPPNPSAFRALLQGSGAQEGYATGGDFTFLYMIILAHTTV